MLHYRILRPGSSIFDGSSRHIQLLVLHRQALVAYHEQVPALQTTNNQPLQVLANTTGSHSESMHMALPTRLMALPKGVRESFDNVKSILCTSQTLTARTPPSALFSLFYSLDESCSGLWWYGTVTLMYDCVIFILFSYFRMSLNG